MVLPHLPNRLHELLGSVAQRPGLGSAQGTGEPGSIFPLVSPPPFPDRAQGSLQVLRNLPVGFSLFPALADFDPLSKASDLSLDHRHSSDRPNFALGPS
jgi:hypothetical protein